MAEINDANQKIELAQTNLTNRTIEISTIDELCDGLRARLAPILGAVNGELIYDAQSLGERIIDTSSKTNEALANDTRDSVYRATEGTPNSHALDARTHMDRTVDTFREASRMIAGPTKELNGLLDRLMSAAKSIDSLLEIVQEGQNRLTEIAGSPDSLPAHPILPLPRQGEQYGTAPESIDNGPASIPATIFALEQFKDTI